uniref:Uncharacterized protein n=1 Tax=Heterorhabditis bacteriophora TaxID=37862 RepID=A0A1I7X5B2_HETBA
MVCGAFSATGLGQFDVCVDEDERHGLKELRGHHLVSNLQRSSSVSITFQRDNAISYVSRSTKTWLKDNDVYTLDRLNEFFMLLIEVVVVLITS